MPACVGVSDDFCGLGPWSSWPAGLDPSVFVGVGGDGFGPAIHNRNRSVCILLLARHIPEQRHGICGKSVVLFVMTSMVGLFKVSAVDHGSGVEWTVYIAESVRLEGLIGFIPWVLLRSDFRSYKVELFLINHHTWVDEFLRSSRLERKWNIACDGGTDSQKSKLRRYSKKGEKECGEHNSVQVERALATPKMNKMNLQFIRGPSRPLYLPNLVKSRGFRSLVLIPGLSKRTIHIRILAMTATTGLPHPAFGNKICSLPFCPPLSPHCHICSSSLWPWSLGTRLNRLNFCIFRFSVRSSVSLLTGKFCFFPLLNWLLMIFVCSVSPATGQLCPLCQAQGTFDTWPVIESSETTHGIEPKLERPPLACIGIIQGGQGGGHEGDDSYRCVSVVAVRTAEWLNLCYCWDLIYYYWHYHIIITSFNIVEAWL